MGWHQKLQRDGGETLSGDGLQGGDDADGELSSVGVTSIRGFLGFKAPKPGT